MKIIIQKEEKIYHVFLSNGVVETIKVEYHRSHGLRQLGVLRKIYPTKHKPSELTMSIVREAETK